MIRHLARLTVIFIFFTFISAAEQSQPESKVQTSSQTNAEAELLELRGEIDIINQEVLKLLNQRAEVVLQIGELKRQNSMKIYDPGREKEIEDNLAELNTGPLPDESVIKIFREIISASRDLQ